MNGQMNGLAFALWSATCVVIGATLFYRANNRKLEEVRRKRRAELDSVLDKMMGSWDDVLSGGTMESAAEYADHVTKENCHDREFCLDQSAELRHESESTDEFYSQWNPTSLANCAYLALHAPEEFRGTYEEEYCKFILWYRTKLSNAFPQQVLHEPPVEPRVANRTT